MKLIYECSNGTQFDLETVTGLRITNEPFHSHTWNPSIVSRKFGSKVTGFTKDAVSYAATFLIDMPHAQTADILDSLVRCFDYDISNQTTGKIYWGSQYIRCYGTEMTVTPSDNFSEEVTVAFYCPYPFWITEREYEWLPSSAADAFLEFPYDFPYDFHTEQGTGLIVNDSVTACDYRMVIYGAVQNPEVRINGVSIGGYVDLDSGDILIIDSRDYSIAKIAQDGTQTDEFTARYKTQDMFAKLKAGSSVVSWSKPHGVGITLYEERSEPRWTI